VPVRSSPCSASSVDEQDPGRTDQQVHRHELDSVEKAELVKLALFEITLATKMMFWLPPCGVITEK
jgi:hypothetical protein